MQISNGLLRKHNNCRFERAVDTHIYVFSKRITKYSCMLCSIIRQLKHEDLGSFKQDFVPFLTKNQNNRQLLKHADSSEELEASKADQPLNVGAWFDREPTTFCKRVLDLKDYEAINMLALVRGPK